MEMKSMLCRPEISNRGFFVSAISISFLILIFAFIITSAPAVSEAAKARKLTDLQKATQLYNKGKYEQAIPLLKKHVEKKPEPEVLYMLGYSLYKIGKHDEAREYFKQSYLVEPEYSPTPVLEKKLNRRLKNARPGKGDSKQAVPQGELPPEAQGLDPSEYRIIDKTSRLKMPETTKSTDTFETAPARKSPKPRKPAKARKPASAKKKKPAQVAAKKESPKAVTQPKPVADKSAPAPAVENKPMAAPVPAPAVENKPVPAPAPSAESKPAPRPAPRRQAPSARPAPGGPGDEMPIPEWLAPLIGGGAIIMVLGVFLVVFLLVSVPLFIIARKLGVKRPALAFIPVVQNWTLTSSAELSFIWGLLITFIPFLALYPIMLVSERLGKGKILGLILALILGPLGLLILAIIGKAGGAAGTASGATDMPDLSGEPDLDLPDMDDMGFDMEDDAFASDEGFGSDEGLGEHTDDFGTAEADSGGGGDFDMDLEPGEDDFNTSSGNSGEDDGFNMDDMSLGDMDDAEGSNQEDEDSFGVDFDDKSF